MRESGIERRQRDTAVRGECEVGGVIRCEAIMACEMQFAPREDALTWRFNGHRKIPQEFHRPIDVLLIDSVCSFRAEQRALNFPAKKRRHERTVDRDALENREGKRASFIGEKPAHRD